METPAPELGPALIGAIERVERRLDSAAPGLADGSDDDYGRRVRVAIRRLRVTLRLARPLMPRSERRELADDLRWLAGLIGEARDWLLSEAGSGSCAREVARQRRLAVQAVRDALASARYRQLRARLELQREQLGHARPLALDKAVGRVARRRFEKLERLAIALGPDSPPTMVHDMRKAAKRLRYTLELLKKSPEHGQAIAGVRAVMKPAQDWLGAYQDVSAEIDLLADLYSRSSASDEPAILHRIKMLSEERRDRAREVDNVAAELLQGLSMLGLSAWLGSLRESNGELTRGHAVATMQPESSRLFAAVQPGVRIDSENGRDSNSGRPGRPG